MKLLVWSLVKPFFATYQTPKKNNNKKILMSIPNNLKDWRENMERENIFQSYGQRNKEKRETSQYGWRFLSYMRKGRRCAKQVVF